MSDQDDLDAFKRLGIDPTDYLNTLLRDAGYQIVRRTSDSIVLTYEGVTRKKDFDHPKHAQNSLMKLLREKEYFEEWELVEDK